MTILLARRFKQSGNGAGDSVLGWEEALPNASNFSHGYSFYWIVLKKRFPEYGYLQRKN